MGGVTRTLNHRFWRPKLCLLSYAHALIALRRSEGKRRWSGRRDSNTRPPGPEPGVLPAALQPDEGEGSAYGSRAEPKAAAEEKRVGALERTRTSTASRPSEPHSDVYTISPRAQELVDPRRFELLTLSMQRRCSPAELRAHEERWWRCGVSNPVPSACHADALPVELHPHGHWN